MRKGNSIYIQYGCGLSCPDGWVNYDVSPSLRLQHLPLVGALMPKLTGVSFPDRVRYGDIVKGLPGIENGSCVGVYCSHILEHLALNDFRKALANTYELLQERGTFRCVLPDLEKFARTYIKSLGTSDPEASIRFMKFTSVGWETRPSGFLNKLRFIYQNHHHLWMWDEYSLINELKKVGFSEVRRCEFGDSKDSMFNRVEDKSRFDGALALEAIK